MTVAASKVSDIDNGYGVTDGGWTVKATTHDGDVEITGLFTLGSSLMVFKRRSVGFIEGFGYQTLQVQAGARGLSRSTGCVGHRTIAPVGDDGVMWLSERGFEYFRVGSRVELASEYQKTFVRGISYGVIREHPGLPHAVWVPGLREYWCWLPVGKGVGSEGLGNTRNSWTWCYRAPSSVSPPAAYMRYLGLESGDGLEVNSDGEIDFVNGASNTPLRLAPAALLMAVDENGELALVALPEPGSGATTLNGELIAIEDSVGLTDASAAVVGRRGHDPMSVYVGTHDNDVYALESGSVEPMPSALFTRPFTFGDEFTRKKAKRVTVLSAQELASTITAYAVVDGVAGSAQTLSMPSTIGAGAAERRIRVGGRGRYQQVRLFTSGEPADVFVPVAIRSILMEAQPLGDQV